MLCTYTKTTTAPPPGARVQGNRFVKCGWQRAPTEMALIEADGERRCSSPPLCPAAVGVFYWLHQSTETRSPRKWPGFAANVFRAQRVCGLTFNFAAFLCGFSKDLVFTVAQHDFCIHTAADLLLFLSSLVHHTPGDTSACARTHTHARVTVCVSLRHPGAYVCHLNLISGHWYNNVLSPRGRRPTSSVKNTFHTFIARILSCSTK